MLRQIDQQDRLSRVSIAPDTPLPEALRRLDRGGLGVLVLVDAERRVAGLLTDGDLRRALLAGDRLKGTCRDVATANPVTAPASIGAGEALVLMDTARPFEINQLPLVDDDGRLAGLLLRSDMVSDSELGVAAVVMAGGLGSRLRPLTDHTPKPMLPVGGRPLMEHIIGQLRQAGIRRVNVTTHYQQDKIAAHFGNGGGFGVDIEYVSEDRPLGTAGALGLLTPGDEPLLVMNGDILTRVDFRSMLAFHRREHAAFTVAVRRYEVEVPYGTVRSDGPEVREIIEKPHFEFLVNAGIYLLEREILELIPSGQRLEMTELIGLAIELGHRVVNYPIVEYWLDIGRPGDYEQAQQDAENGTL